MKNTRYQIKVTLKGIRPPIWRRLLIPVDCTMDTVNRALEHWDCNLQSFMYAGVCG